MNPFALCHPPKHIALQYCDQQFSYETLNALIKQKALLLSKATSPLTLQATLSVDSLITILAALQCAKPLMILNPHSPHIPSYEKICLDTPCLFFQSSGSTGDPKWISLSIDNLYYNALGAAEYFSLNHLTRWLSPLPLFHVGGIGAMLRTFLVGGTLLWPKSVHTLASELIHFSPTHCSLVPTQLYRLLNSGSLSTQTHYIVGGAKAPLSLLEKAKKQNLLISLTYGLTEMGSMVSAGSYSLGFPLPYRKLKLSMQQEILVSGETLSYPLIKQSPWFATKDLGAFNQKGELIVLGRKDRLLIKGGENIHPEEIEEALYHHPSIESAIVIAIPDPEYGEIPIAFISPPLNEQNILSHLLDYLPKFKLPKRIFSLPESPGIKPSIHQLLAIAQANDASLVAKA